MQLYGASSKKKIQQNAASGSNDNRTVTQSNTIESFEQRKKFIKKFLEYFLKQNIMPNKGGVVSFPQIANLGRSVTLPAVHPDNIYPNVRRIS